MESSSIEFQSQSDVDINFNRPLLSDNYDDSDECVFAHPTNGVQDIFGGVQILVNTAMGSGALLIPYCYTSGLASGIIIAGIFCILSTLSQWLMVQAAKESRGYDFCGLFEKAVGKKFVWIVHLIIVIVLFGVTSIYTLFGGHLFNLLLNSHKKPFNTDWFWVLILSVFFVLPLTIPKTLKKLEPFATLSTMCLIVLILNSLYWFIKDLVSNGNHIASRIRYFVANRALISNLSINSMAYNCHVNLFSCLSQLKNCTVRRSKRMIAIAMGVCFLLYNSLGIFSYLFLGDKIEDNSILDYYDQNNTFTKIATICVVFVMIISAPLVLHACRNALNGMFFEELEPSTCRWITMGFILVILSATLVCSFGKVMVFFDIVGGLFVPCLLFLFPGLCYYRICQCSPLYKRIFALVMCFLSFCVSSISIYKTITDL